MCHGSSGEGLTGRSLTPASQPPKPGPDQAQEHDRSHRRRLFLGATPSRCPRTPARRRDLSAVLRRYFLCGASPGKKVPGRKRHLVVDTKGLMLGVMVTPAGQPDRDAARELLARLRMLHPQLTLVWGDSAYAGTLVEWARRFLRLTIKIVTKLPGQTGFKVSARRWIVERSLAWMMNARRDVIDYERLSQHSEAHLTWASITLMTRRLTRKNTQSWSRARPVAAARRAIR
jgi:transposase